MRIHPFTLLLLTLAFVAACTPTASSPAGSTPTQQAITDYAALVHALKAEGAAAQLGEDLSDSTFSVKGRILDLPPERVQVMEYPTEADAHTEAGKISPDGHLIGETRVVDWIAPPHFYRVNRLIVLYVGRDQATLDLLERVLGPQFAGAPPDRPTPTIVNSPTAVSHNSDIADLLRNPPAPGASVEVDAYYSGATFVPVPDPRIPSICPSRGIAALTDRPLLAQLYVLHAIFGNGPPDDAPWLIAAKMKEETPELGLVDLPYHARLRGHLGDPAFAQCQDAERIFVVEAVVATYQREPPESQSPIRLPDDYATWHLHHDEALGYSLRYPVVATSQIRLRISCQILSVPDSLLRLTRSLAFGWPSEGVLQCVPLCPLGGNIR